MRLELEDGVSLHYESAGDPQSAAVLLWHGARCTLRQWDLIIERIADRFHVVRFDIRGAGRSGPGRDEDYNFSTYATDARQLLDHLNIDQCHVWSMAWGSRAALYFSATNPDRVKSASLFDLSIGTADVAAQVEGTKQARRKQRAAGVVLPALPAGWNEHLDENALAKSLAAAGKVNLAAYAKQLNMPVLVATGDHDPNLASSREAVALMPQSTLVELPDVGHGSVLMRPDLCTDVFLEFVLNHV